MIRQRTVFRIVFVLTVFSSCTWWRGTKSTDVPAWVNRLPESKGRLYALGISGPTYFTEDGKANAADNARKELAKALSVRVQALSLSLQQNKERRENEISLVTVTSWATDIVVSHSQILETWIDEEARVPNSQPGTVYALAAIDLEVAQEAVGSYLKSGKAK